MVNKKNKALIPGKKNLAIFRKPVILVTVFITIFFIILLNYFLTNNRQSSELKEAQERYLQKPNSTQPTNKTLAIETATLVGTKWNYDIKAGGGVGGVMTFESENGNKLLGSFTEYGPSGRQDKLFTAIKTSNTLELDLTDFPTFLVAIANDGKSMVGKPKEEQEGISYEDNFFEAKIMQ